MAHKPETDLIGAGRKPRAAVKLPNPPVERASTVLIERAEDLYDGDRKVYGRFGLGSQDALCDALCALYEGASWCGLTPSGLSACTLSIQALCKTGDHVLITDSAYGPTRSFALEELSRQGVKVEFYDPRIAGGVAELIRDNTALIYLESPGSLTLDVQNVPAICAAAKARGVATLIDDTWSAGLLCDVFALGCDVAIQAATKYPSGHSEVLLGAILTMDADLGARIGHTLRRYGVTADSDSCYLALRGLRTLSARMKQHEASGLASAEFLQRQPGVARVIHPGLPGNRDHEIWKRDFNGASGLFAFELAGGRETANRFLNALNLFGLGFSWGGFESLAIVCNPQIRRAVTPWDGDGQLIRLSIGLENAGDLIADLEQALAAAKDT